jgi:hypothetical protein
MSVFPMVLPSAAAEPLSPSRDLPPQGELRPWPVTNDTCQLFLAGEPHGAH